MERIHIDIAGPVKDIYYLVIVDAFSKYPEIVSTRSITSLAVIKILSEFFARFGQPCVIVSDNGTQFISEKFKDFCAERKINHIRTAPYHPQSNGQAERFVDTLKRALKKSDNSEANSEVLQEFLLAYRSTPNRNVPEHKSPAELFINRKIKTNIDLLKYSTLEHRERNHKMELQFNIKHGAKHRHFNIGEGVYVKEYKNNKMFWIPATVIQQIGNVNYMVETHPDKTEYHSRRFKSHVNQMRKRSHSNRQQFLETLVDVFTPTVSPPPESDLSPASSAPNSPIAPPFSPLTPNQRHQQPQHTPEDQQADQQPQQTSEDQQPQQTSEDQQQSEELEFLPTNNSTPENLKSTSNSQKYSNTVTSLDSSHYRSASSTSPEIAETTILPNHIPNTEVRASTRDRKPPSKLSDYHLY